MTNGNNDAYYLDRCKRLIEEKLNWLPAEEWRNYEFTELSEKILDATDVNLSPTTLKRLFGRLKYESLPSSVTLNSLAKYLGFENWMDFKSKQLNENGKKTVITEETGGEKKSYRFSKPFLLTTSMVLILIVVFGFVFLSNKSATDISLQKNIVFSSRPLAKGLPNSVLFTIDLNGITSKNILIQQSWDSTKTIKLKPGQTEATGFYYNPGYYRAKLIIDGIIVKEHDLFIKTEEWIATIDFEPVPTYLKKDELLLKNCMTVSDAVIDKIKEIKNPTTLTYQLVKPFGGLPGDNFRMEASIKNIFHEGPAVCETSKIFILCTEGAFIIPFSIPGCVENINLKLNDNTLEGKSNDLSNFGTDLNQWNKVKVEVKDRFVKIFLNNQLIREEKYERNAGEVVGLRFAFLGAGAVEKVKMLNEKGELAYQDFFNE